MQSKKKESLKCVVPTVAVRVSVPKMAKQQVYTASVSYSF